MSDSLGGDDEGSCASYTEVRERMACDVMKDSILGHIRLAADRRWGGGGVVGSVGVSS